MSRVTSKRQVTIPKAVADRYAIAPGAEIVFEPAGDVIRVVPPRRPVPDPLARQRQRETGRVFPEVQDRGWSREDLYDRGRPR